VSAVRRLAHRAPAWAGDALLAAAFAVLSVIDLLGDGIGGPAWVAAPALGLMSALPLVRRRRPLLAVSAWAGLTAVLALVVASDGPLLVPFLGLFLFPYGAAARADGRRALLALPPVWLAMTATALSAETFVWGDIFFPAMFGSLFWLGGRAVRSRSRLTAELHEAAIRAGEDHEAGATQAVADERRRIAREMHDVVAHSVSMMVIQAGGARRILHRDPGRAVAAAALIERSGREALAEMRHLLGVLHAEDGHPPEFAPQPRLREVDALVARARAAGVPVALHVDGERRDLPAGLDLAAYRVVQEALTNVMKHGGGAATEVRVRYGGDAVEVTVADRGGGALPVRLDGSGAGLLGMRERVRVYGGELHAGRRAGGGFEVHVRLPVQDEDEAALAAGARS